MVLVMEKKDETVESNKSDQVYILFFFWPNSKEQEQNWLSEIAVHVILYTTMPAQ